MPSANRSRKYDSVSQKRKRKQRIEDLTQSPKGAMDRFIIKESQVDKWSSRIKLLIKVMHLLVRLTMILQIVMQQRLKIILRVSNLLLITQTGKPIMTDNLNTSPIADDDDSFQPDIYLIQDIGISLILKKLTF